MDAKIIHNRLKWVYCKQAYKRVDISAFGVHTDTPLRCICFEWEISFFHFQHMMKSKRKQNARNLWTLHSKYCLYVFAYMLPITIDSTERSFQFYSRHKLHIDLFLPNFPLSMYSIQCTLLFVFIYGQFEVVNDQIQEL